MSQAATTSPLRLAWRTEASARVRGAVWNRALMPFAAIAAITFVVRLIHLDGRPLHHDESSHAWFSWLLATGRGYEYNPVFHGPVQFYSGVLGYALAGIGDLGIRLLPALLGGAITVLPFLLRRQLGTMGALTASVLLAISPSYVYYSRFAREDIYAAVVTFALLVAAFRFLDRPRPWHPAVVLGLLAAAFATKETAYITAFVGGTFFIAVAVRDLWRRRSGPIAPQRTPLLNALRTPGLNGWVWGLCSFALVFAVLFTTFLTNPEGLRDGAYESIRYWLSQHEVERGGQPVYFYGVLLIAYELPILLLAAWGVVSIARRPTLLRVFLVWMFVVSLLVYSWAGERMPWLVLHPLLPLILLAGVGAQDLWQRRRGVRVAAAVGAVAGAAFLVHGAVAAGYRHPADPAELLVFVQTSTQLEPARDQILDLHQRGEETGRPVSIHVDTWGGTGWPWGWYLRDVPVFYTDMSSPTYSPKADVVVVAEVNQPFVKRHLRDFVGRRFLVREWWVVEYDEATPRDILDWFVHRRSWSVEGTMGEWIYVRKALASRLSGKGPAERRPPPSTELRRGAAG